MDVGMIVLLTGVSASKLISIWMRSAVASIRHPDTAVGR